MSAPMSILSPERGLHALLLAPVTAHAGDYAHLLDLELPHGLWRRARLGRGGLRRDTALEGRFLATLHLRSDTAGGLKNPLSLVALEPLGDTAPLPRWEVLGQVVRLDLPAGLLTVRVLPQAGVRPFLLHLQVPPDAEWRLPRLTRWHFAGRLEGEGLWLEQVWAPTSAETTARGVGGRPLARGEPQP